MVRTGLLLIVTLLFAQQPAAQRGGGAAAGAPQTGRGSAGAPAAMVDYEIFKTRVQPILMGARKGNARCISCHASGGGNSFLDPLTPGSSTYTEEQTRRNFDRVSRLVTTSEPLKSILLMNPLAEEAGGSHWHGGGKHWQSQDNPEWQTLAAWVRTRSTGGVVSSVISAPPAVPAAPATPAPTAAQAAAISTLDFEVFKTRVQPILMSARKGNARCISCHASGGGNSFLDPLAPGSTTYTEEQARRNFERVARLVTTGEPLKSILLMNPLAEEAGGSHWHGGGKHWPSQGNPEWQTLATWVRGGRP